jgi:uncharacterized membrane protein
VNIDPSELRKGWLRTRQYLLSHHGQSELYRCYTTSVFSRRIDLCARCSGIYPAILLGGISYSYAPPELASPLLVAILPLPAIVDWAWTSLTERCGFNLIRTITGALLGYGYGVGISHLIFGFNPQVIVIGLGYAIATALLVYIDIST